MRKHAMQAIILAAVAVGTAVISTTAPSPAGAGKREFAAGGTRMQTSTPDPGRWIDSSRLSRFQQ